jgi:hypothetical protein
MSVALPVQHRSDTLRGIALMLASMAIIVVNDTLMKVAAGELPTGQTIFVRGLLTSERRIRDRAPRRLQARPLARGS